MMKQTIIETKSTVEKKPTADQVKKAEELKSLGNKKMSAKDFPEAIKFYTEAISLDGNNAVYYANRYLTCHFTTLS